ncbi:TD and POZ domain-containing protein 1-like [Argiope bruennichi]|uniref:TD and POZ domain-containing protein 1-like n=1 Tax=Argiope bruennichi TaxID=94029 RepID=UPI002493F9A3|nr:TD and POZ domain-containing protein 1-like [Argiope bruennichi]XP_055951358.1 TD and POZ domain-containing protein 1-like [Argiope bruennichi]
MIETEAEVERVSFVGVVEAFGDLTSDGTKPIRIISTSGESLQFSMNIGLTRDQTIFLEVKPLNCEKTGVCRCLLNLLDSTRTKIAGEGWFRYDPKKRGEQGSGWKIPLKFPERHLMYFGNQYFQKECLDGEIAFCTGNYTNKILKMKCETNLCNSIHQVLSSKQNVTENIEEENRLIFTVQDDLMSLLSSGNFSDTTLQTPTETFPAHKLILSARSPVFRAMFTNNMKENIKECVRIEDLDADTVRRLLLFLYSDSLKDLDLESAKKLYFAGDKYEVLSLRHKCAHFLEKNLCPSSCCDVLVLADRHSDSCLKKVVQEYISHHDKEVYQTDQWKQLEQTNPVLTFETLRVMYEKSRKFT